MINIRSKPLTVLIRSAAACIVVLGTISCCLASPIPRTNIVMAHRQGWAQDPADFKRLETKEYDDYINEVFRDLATYCKGRKEETCKVLFFFHGGLNSRDASISRATRLQQRIKDSGSYPIFVSWNSSLPSTWWSHVARVRKGIAQGNGFAVLFPYFAAVDEVKSIAEAPVAWWAELRHTFPILQRSKNQVPLDAYTHLLKEEGGIVINDILDKDNQEKLADGRRLPQKITSYATLPVTLPTKILAPPLLIQAAGQGAWDIMERRAVVLFRTEDEFKGLSPEQIGQLRTASSRVPQTGAALAHFISRFQSDFAPTFCRKGTYPFVEEGSETTASIEEQEPKIREESPTPPACKGRLEITLVGHSMGTIIVDEWLRYAPNMRVNNIVFMAAASTVNDYRHSVLPYLEKNPDTRMFHLILHPRAEVSEKGFLDLSPRGSLLVWIDNYFTNPITPLDRTVGRFFNLLPELLYTPDDVRNRVNLKVFRVGKSLRCGHPQRHGDFGLFPFWDPNFWEPNPKTGQKPYVRWDDKRCGDPL